MVEYLKTFVHNILKLPIFPDHWDTYFYQYFNFRENGYPRKEAKEQALKRAIWKYKNNMELFIPEAPLEISKETVEATSEIEAAMKVVNSHLDMIKNFNMPPKDEGMYWKKIKKKCTKEMTIGQKGITDLQQILYNDYTIMPESNEDSLLLIQKKHVVGTLTYSLKEPLKISPSHDTIIVCRFKARKIRENVYEVTQKFLSTEDRLTTPIHESPDLH
jgi:hypothetical protein